MTRAVLRLEGIVAYTERYFALTGWQVEKEAAA